MRLRQLAAVLALTATLGCGSHPTRTTRPDPDHGPLVANGPRTRVTPKSLDDTVTAGLGWLAKHQLASGGWGQGDESSYMGDSMAAMRDTANVADTSVALLALLRAGNTARTGKYQDAVQKGVDYVLGEIDASDADSLKITNVTGTRVQMKIGPYVDTFAALMVLTEAQGGMRDAVANARLDAALKKLVHKVEKNQRDNGSWDDNGWAPVLSQAIAAKGLNRAYMANIPVSKTTLDRVQANAQSAYDTTSRTFGTATGTAGVEMYGAAASSAANRDTAESKKARAAGMKAAHEKHEAMMQAPDAPTAAEVKAAEAEASAAVMAADETDRALIARLDEPTFIAGFGNNGGEEYLSYLLISETLVQKGGDEWVKWDRQITQLVDKVQNEDGSWTGMHCITGRTFCTATALLVLMGDRTPAPKTTIAS